MRVVGYARVSTTEQANFGTSIEMQKAKIEGYAKLHDFDLIEIIVDEGFSATTLKKREGVQRVLKTAYAGDVAGVVVFKLDRMFRNTADALAVSTRLQKKGVAFHSVSESIDTTSALGKFFFTVLASIAEMERNLIAERTSAVLQHKKEQGQVYNHAPYGFDAVDGKLVKNRAEQSCISLMIANRKCKWSYPRIADDLNSNKIPTKKSGGQWHAASVKKIIKRVTKDAKNEQ